VLPVVLSWAQPKSIAGIYRMTVTVRTPEPVEVECKASDSVVDLKAKLKEAMKVPEVSIGGDVILMSPIRLFCMENHE
jgi:hypothetical protein